MAEGGNVNAAIEAYRRHASPWRSPRMRIWISPDTIGIVTSPTKSAGNHAHQAIEMTKDEKQAMDVHGITCKPKDVYYYKGFRYERLADAVRYAEINADRPGPKGRKT